MTDQKALEVGLAALRRARYSDAQPLDGPFAEGVAAYLAALPVPPAGTREAVAGRTDVDCLRCGKPVGNSVFTVCDDCWPAALPVPREGEANR